MIVKRVIAGAAIERGEFVTERPGGRYYPEPSMKSMGGVARKPYAAWPPEPIVVGEEFEIMTDGGIQAIVGVKPMWVEIRDGHCRPDLLSPTALGEYRLALSQAGISPD